MSSEFTCRFGAMIGRTACMFAVGFLICVASTYGQITKEGGFPGKGDGASNGSYSLSCPSRLYVAAGGSSPISCDAAGVPAEGIRYEWESLSEGGLDLLSASNELSPLFAAPVSGGSPAYEYRLTATGLGVYATASVTVSVENIPGQSSVASGLREDCDPFALPEELGETCLEDKGPSPFGLGSEEEFLFPDGPGLPDRPFGPVREGGFDSWTPPRLECPAAVFLEELETDSIACYAWDASGEEYLDFAWEPAGSTTRDYLDNPRLIPEDSPTPSVIAPETSAHETLESFFSERTTLRYRYRLTATSRATGLSSFSEVEVYVSSSRPGVYCPPEIEVEEGKTISLDCEGVDPLSFRMDYDEESASVLWEWQGLWGTDTAPLGETDRSSPLFTAPPGSAGKEFHYIASMTSSASGLPRTARRKVTVRIIEKGISTLANKGSAPVVTCEDAEVYEGASAFPLDCSVTDEPSDPTYSWVANTSGAPALTADATLTPTFSPPSVDETTVYEYTVTLSATGVDNVTEDVTVTVKNKPGITVTCTDYSYEVDEDDSDFDFDCSADDAPGDDPEYAWSWSPTDHLTDDDTGAPAFSIPDVDKDTTYTYKATVTAANADDGTATVSVTVKDIPAPVVTCEDAEVYEGASDFPLDCSVENEPPGATYSWTGDGVDEILTNANTLTPTFSPPSVEEETKYEYTVTLSAADIDNVTADVTVTVKKKPDITVICTDYSYDVDEDDSDFDFDCSADDAPGDDPEYAWSWSPTDHLTDDDTGAPTFSIPDEDEDTTYTYKATVTAANAKPGTATVTVTVLDKTFPRLQCQNSEVYEDEVDFINLDCSARNAPPGAAYRWDGDDLAIAQLSDTDRLTPRFRVPDDLSAPFGLPLIYVRFNYTVTMTAGSVDVASADVMVKVFEKPDITSCITHRGYAVDEGDADFNLVGCLDDPQGAPGENPAYRYKWTNYGASPASVLDRLNNTESRTPLFSVPSDVPSNTIYEYLHTISADNADDFTSVFTVVVEDLDSGDFNLACARTLYSVNAGDDDFEIECEASRAPSDAIWEWTAHGTTSNTDRLSATNIRNPVFDVPGWSEVSLRSHDFYYNVSVSAGSQRQELVVRIRVSSAIDGLSFSCATKAFFLEGDDDRTIGNCSVRTHSGILLPPEEFDWTWMARGDTEDTSLLSATDIPNPVFDVPDSVDEHEVYEYTVEISWVDGRASYLVSVTVLDRESFDGILAIECEEYDYEVYEGSENITFDCEASGAPEGKEYSYDWRGGALATARLIEGKDGPTPTFATPPGVEEDKTYEYTLVVTAQNSLSASADITVTVLNKEPLVVTCARPPAVYEDSPDFALDCAVSNVPPGSVPEYTWTPGRDTQDTALLSATNIVSPTFYVPDELDANKTYRYTLTVSAENAEDGTANVTVRILNKKPLIVTCARPPVVYEDSPDFALDCAVSNVPPGSVPEYTWTPGRDTQDTALLSATNIVSPTFYVPDELDANKTYRYTLTASAENAEDGTANVTVRILNKKQLSVVCAAPAPVFEGSENFDLECTATGAPAGSSYDYVWTGRGSTQNTDLLIAGTDGPTPTFEVPEAVEEEEMYEYLLTVSAENADDATAEVAVQVLKLGTIALICASPPLVYEGSEDFVLDCSIAGATEGVNYTYEWTARGDTENTSLLSAADVASPTFYVPEAVDATTRYEYLLTARAENTVDATAEATVIVLDRDALAVACSSPPPVYEGSADFALDCSASGGPAGSAYDYVWTPRGDTQDTSLLSATDIASPMFLVPDDVAATTTYEYLLTVSAANAESGSATLMAMVLNTGELHVVCASYPPVYEGSADFALDCEAAGAPVGSAYAYAWTAQGDTEDTSLLSAANIASPTFLVPDDVAATTTYEYLLTASAENAEDGSGAVSVTVLNAGALLVACADPGSVYEGSDDIVFDCSASGAPAGAAYAYVWTSRGDTQDTSLLSATDILSPSFAVPDEVDAAATYEYLLTVSADNAEDGVAEVSVTVLDKEVLAVACADPGSVYEGSDDITFDCEASGASGSNPAYTYVWAGRAGTVDTNLLSATDIASPTFHVPDNVDETTTYEYRLIVSAENAEDATAQVAVTVLNKGALAVACADPGSVYEGSDDIAFDCEASGAPGADPQYIYAWTARGDTPDTALLSDTHIATPVFYVPDAIEVTTMYEYLLTVSAENAEAGVAEVTVTVLDKPVLAVVCADPGSVYEGSDDVAFDCEASGAPGDGPQYIYAWTARGDTPDTALLSATDIASPIFATPEEVDGTTTYEYLLTVSAENSEDGAAEVSVTVLDRIVTPDPDPDPDPDPVSPPVASSDRTSSDLSALGVTASASPLRFGVQSAGTQVSLDPATDLLSTYVSGPYHVGRMTLSPGGGAALDENEELDLSIELVSPFALKRADGIEAASLALTPAWSFAESCEQLSSQMIGGLYTEATLTKEACLLLRFGGELDLTGAPSGQYAGTMDVILRSGENEETHSVEAYVTVVPAQRVITIGPSGVRFDTSRELPGGLAEEQNMSIYPDVAFLTEEKPNGVLELSNPSLIPLEISVAARFGYTEATEDGREVVVVDVASSELGDLSDVVDIHPGILVLQPGEKSLVRYGVREDTLALLSKQGYAAFFEVTSEPRQYVRSDRMPEAVAGGRTARLTMRIPGVYIPGDAASRLDAQLLSVSYVGRLSATFLLETKDGPFVGEVAAYDGAGRELGRGEALVYTRSRVRISLNRIPEEGTVTLRFLPRGSYRMSGPVSVEWNASRTDTEGDIGAVQDERDMLPGAQNTTTEHIR